MARRPSKLNIKVEGLQELLRKLDPKVLEGPFERFHDKSSRYVAATAAAKAPKGATGRLRRSHTSSVERGVGVVQRSQAGSFGVFYAGWVHYGTQHAPKGQPWLRQAGVKAKPTLRAYVKNLADDLERAWARA